MRISGHLVPFPDIGAADLMSDHLEQIVQAEGPGKISCKISLPSTLLKSPGVPSASQAGFARKMVEIAKQEGADWLPVLSTTTDSHQALEEIFCDVVSAGTFKCKVMNMSGTGGQFSLDSTFLPYPMP
jgi:hypothetical protein